MSDVPWMRHHDEDYVPLKPRPRVKARVVPRAARVDDIEARLAAKQRAVMDAWRGGGDDAEDDE
jgi:hypothetical protein